MLDVAIVGGGISGLTLGFELRERGIRAQVLEARSVAGGTIQTVEEDGFHFETGPNGFLSRMPDTYLLAQRLGLQEQIISASPAAKTRYLFLGGELKPLPSGPFGLLGTSTLPLGARLRVFKEPFVRRRPAGLSEETVAGFVERRLGAAFVDTYVDAFVSGVFAGDPHRLSMDAAFPAMVAAEANHGSLVRGAMRSARARKKTNTNIPKGLLSFRGGMGVLIRALEEELGTDGLQLNTPVKGLKRATEGWEVQTDDELLTARSVVVATPAYRASALIEEIDADCASQLSEIPYAPVCVVGLGFERDQVRHPLDGFGYLCPEKEGRPILGCLFTSSVYAGCRAPANRVLLRIMLGGIRHPETIDGSDVEVVERALGEVRGPLGIKGDPCWTRMVRWERAIPQYHLGHQARVVGLRERLADTNPGLFLHGNAYEGVSVNDCIRTSGILADRIISELSSS